MNHSKLDTFLNTSLIAAGIVGILLVFLDEPTFASASAAVASLVVSESRA